MREALLSDWLSATDWAKWSRNPIAGDASARKYERLAGPSGKTAILMDAPPDICGSQRPFVDIAKHLSGAGLLAPEIFAWSDDLGLLIISDLGNLDFAKHLNTHPNDERELYENAVDVLRKINDVPPPKELTKMTPEVGVDMVGLAFEWAAQDKSPNLQVEVETELRSLLTQVDPSPRALSLRDFHAENLIWRSDQKGTGRVGLLDFQDAFITHPTYDLASLLRDARRDVSGEMLDDLLHQLDPDADKNAQRFAFHVMAIQRNLRILGIFRRLAKREGKTRYLDFVPRVENHLRVDLAAPELNSIKPLITRAFFGHSE